MRFVSITRAFCSHSIAIIVFFFAQTAEREKAALSARFDKLKKDVDEMTAVRSQRESSTHTHTHTPHSCPEAGDEAARKGIGRMRHQEPNSRCKHCTAKNRNRTCIGTCFFSISTEISRDARTEERSRRGGFSKQQRSFASNRRVGSCHGHGGDAQQCNRCGESQRRRLASEAQRGEGD